MKRPFVYDPENPRREAVLELLCDFTRKAGRRMVVVVQDPAKSREQEQKYHAMIGDIADQVPFHGRMRDADTFWKRLLIDAFKHDTKDDADLAVEWAKFGGMELVPALNHPGFVSIGEQSRNFSVKLAKAFIDWLDAYGAENDVRWSEPKAKAA
jgi:hypothetical protein